MPTPTRAPVRKVAAGGVAGALVTVIVVVLGLVWPNTFSQLPDGFEAALTTLATFLVSYFTPPGADETVVTDAGGTRSAKK